MSTTDEEYIAYKPDKYTHTYKDSLNLEDEDELAYENNLKKFKWNRFINEYNSLAASDITYKRVKRQNEPLPETNVGDIDGGGGAEEGGGGGEGGGDGGGVVGGGDGGGGGGKEGAKKSKEISQYLTPIFVLTAFFGLMIIVGPFLVRKGPNRGIVQGSIMLTGFCMWIFWVTVYIGQMNPLMGPRLENTTVAWMSVKVGDAIKPPAAAPAGGEAE